MMPLLSLHAIAAARGEGLQPELLSAITQEGRRAVSGIDRLTQHASLECLDGLGSAGDVNLDLIDSPCPLPRAELRRR